MWTVPSDDQHWNYLKAHHDEPIEKSYPFEDYGRGGESFAFQGITDTKPLVLMYSQLHDRRTYLGYIGWCADDSAVWEMAGLDEEDGFDEADVQSALSEYEAGSLDFVTEMRDHGIGKRNELGHAPDRVWWDSFEAADEPAARRYMEAKLSELISGL